MDDRERERREKKGGGGWGEKVTEEGSMKKKIEKELRIIVRERRKSDKEGQKHRHK